MGRKVDPSLLTSSGEQCIRNIILLESRTDESSLALATILPPIEAHLMRMLGHLILEDSLTFSPFAQALYDEQQKSFQTLGWTARLKWFKTGFDLSLAGSPEYQKLDTLIQARNAVMHGDGQLTDLQIGGDLTKLVTLKRRLKSDLDINCRGIKMTYGESVCANAFSVAVAFVTSFDQKLLLRHPHLKSV